MQQSISYVVTTKIGRFVSIIQHIIFEKFNWCPSKYHEMKILLPVTSAKIWPESGMLTINITMGHFTSDSIPTMLTIEERHFSNGLYRITDITTDVDVRI